MSRGGRVLRELRLMRPSVWIAAELREERVRACHRIYLLELGLLLQPSGGDLRGEITVRKLEPSG